MKTIAVISDSHGNRAAIDKLFPVFAECDFIVHLGDTSSDGAYIKKSFPDKTFVLNGNCDLERLGENELVIKAEDVKIFACHGHLYGVKYGFERLAYRALEEGCRVALFGHTHHACETEAGGVALFNPGALRRYAENSYLYLVVNKDKAVGKIVKLGE